MRMTRARRRGSSSPTAGTTWGPTTKRTSRHNVPTYVIGSGPGSACRKTRRGCRKLPPIPAAKPTNSKTTANCRAVVNNIGRRADLQDAAAPVHRRLSTGRRKPTRSRSGRRPHPARDPDLEQPRRQLQAHRAADQCARQNRRCRTAGAEAEEAECGRPMAKSSTFAVLEVSSPAAGTCCSSG